MSTSSPVLLLLFLASLLLVPSSVSAAAGDVSVLSHPSRFLLLPPGVPVDASPGARPGVALACARVRFRALSRLRSPFKYAHALKVHLSVTQGDALFRLQTTELCFHKNASVGMGMCPAAQWEKLSKSSWSRSISPYEDRILDVRMLPDPSRMVEVSTEEAFLFHRVIFLILGVVMMMMAHTFSESVVFYYGSAMTIGIILVILVVLFQGMKLLPTGRRSSLAFFAYSSIVGFGTFLLHYLSGLLRTILVEIGITEDMHNPLAMLLLLCLVLAGAWFGYWGVRKFVLTEEGLVDSGVALFVKWAILIISVLLILQSSLDSLFAAEALGFTIVTLAMTRKFRVFRLIRRMVKGFRKALSQSSHRHSDAYYNSNHVNNVRSQSPMTRANSYNLAPCNSPLTEMKNLLNESFYSSYHRTPEKKKFSKQEWDAFTREQTSKGLRELASSPEFSNWVSTNIERITLTPQRVHKPKRGLFFWFLGR